MDKIKILLIDDNTKFIDSLSRYLEITDSNYEIYKANTGEEGLKILKERKPHLLLCDLFMLDIDGDEIIEKTKTISPRTISVILTAYIDEKTDERLRKIGIDDIIYKPIDDLGDFVLRIEQILLKKGCKRS